MKSEKDFQKTLLEKRDALKSGDNETISWFFDQKLLYSFDKMENLLVVGTNTLYLTNDGSLSSKTYWDNGIKEFLSKEQQERIVLYFIPANLSLEKYELHSPPMKDGYPLPKDFFVTSLECHDDIFIISSKTNSKTISGTFYVLRTALDDVKYFYLTKGVSEAHLEESYYQVLPNEHQTFLNYQKEEEKRLQKKETTKETLLLKVEDFSLKESEYSWEGTITLWGKETTLYLSYYEEEEAGFEKFLKQLNTHLTWIEQNKLWLFYAIVDDGMVYLANDWMADYEIVEQDESSYYELEDGGYFPYPITTQSFLDSLHLAEINGSDDFLFDLFFETVPDFFAYHNIEVFLSAHSEEHYTISVNGLAG